MIIVLDTSAAIEILLSKGEYAQYMIACMWYVQDEMMESC